MKRLLLALGVLTLADAAAQESPPEDVLREMGAFYAASKSFSADVTATYTIQGLGRTHACRTDYRLAVRRPRQFSLVLTRSEADGRLAFDGTRRIAGVDAYALDLICDGENVFYYASPADAADLADARRGGPPLPAGVPPLRKPVTRFKAPSDLAGLDPQDIRTEWTLGFLHPHVLPLARGKPEEWTAELKKTGTLKSLGTEELGSVKCRRVRYEATHEPLKGRKEAPPMHVIREFWIAAGPRPWLLRESLEDRVGDKVSYSMTLAYEGWRLDPPLADADFDLPRGVESAPPGRVPENPDEGLAGYWKFDEKEGASAADSSGKGNHGTYVNGPEPSPDVHPGRGANAGCRVFAQGKEQRVEVKDAPSLRPTGSFTLAVWVKPAADRSEFNQGVIEKFSWTGTEAKGGFSLRLSKERNLLFAVNPETGGPKVCWSSEKAVAGAWSHIAGVYDSETRTARAYLNGGVVAFEEAVPPPGETDQSLRIGSDYGAHAFHGGLDEIRIYARALSAAEIRFLASRK